MYICFFWNFVWFAFLQRFFLIGFWELKKWNIYVLRLRCLHWISGAIASRFWENQYPSICILFHWSINSIVNCVHDFMHLRFCAYRTIAVLALKYLLLVSSDTHNGGTLNTAQSTNLYATLTKRCRTRIRWQVRCLVGQCLLDIL